MGEAKRRRPAGTVIEGPFSYQIGAYRLDDILEGGLRAMFGERPSAQTVALMKAAAKLSERIADPSLPAMLCAFCDYEFASGEPPTEILVALPWANPEHPSIMSPICPGCAEASEDAKTDMAKAHWSKLSPGTRFDGPGHA